MYTRILRAVNWHRQVGLFSLSWLAPAILACSFRIAISAADEGPLQSAQTLLLRGRYEEAAEAFAKLEQTTAEAAVGHAQCLHAQGKSEEAAAVVKEAAGRFPEAAEVFLEQAQIAFDAGDHPSALEATEQALAKDANFLPARWLLAELLRLSGKLDSAQREYRAVLDFHRREKATTAAGLHAVGLAAAQLARLRADGQEFQRLVGEHYPALLKKFPKYWPARLELARLFAEKFNEPEAEAQLAAALVINSQAAEVHAARAALAGQNYDLPAVEAAAKRALAANPRCIAALLCEADALLADVRPAEALVVLEKARIINPVHEPLLGRLVAATATLEGFPEGKSGPRAQALIDAALQRNPQCGELFLAVGDAFDHMRRFNRAADEYRRAQARLLDPHGARAKLGLTLLRLGDEQEAARLLQDSFNASPYNVRVRNSLEVLDLLSGYAVLETEHFVLKFDRGQDGILAEYAAQYLEDEVYPELCRKFQFELPQKTLIEIFSRARGSSGHAWFSARMVGLPFIGTVGACAGKMIAVASPSEFEKKFDWGRLLKHEMTHVFNLQQTDFQCPHWLTEGLAVESENVPQSTEWRHLLAKRAAEGTLLHLDNITWGFIRPQTSEDRPLAYAQAELYVRFMRLKYAQEAPEKLLAALADRLSTDAAIHRACGVSQAELEKAYRGYLTTIVAEATKSAAVPFDFATLERQAAKMPQNADLQAALAKAWLDRGGKAPARKYAVAAKELEPRHPLAAYVLARLQLSIGESDAARELLNATLDDEQLERNHLALLAALAEKSEDFARAVRYYERGRAKWPDELSWLNGLIRCASAMNDNDRLLPALTQLAAADSDNLSCRKQLARAAHAARDWPQLARWTEEVLRLDILDAEMHALLGVAAASREQWLVAKRQFQTAIRIEPQDASHRIALATALIALKDRATARKELEAALAIDADLVKARELLDQLKE